MTGSWPWAAVGVGLSAFPIVVRYTADGKGPRATVTRDVTETTFVTEVADSAENLTYYGRFINGQRRSLLHGGRRHETAEE